MMPRSLDPVFPFQMCACQHPRGLTFCDLRSLVLIEQTWDPIERMGLQLLTAQAKRLLRQAGIRLKRGDGM